LYVIQVFKLHFRCR